MWSVTAGAVGVATTVTGWVLAVTSDSLVDLGVAGVVLGAFMTGIVVAKPTVDRLASQVERSDSKNEQLTKDVMERVMPALNEAIHAIQAQVDVKEVLADVRDVLTDVRRLLEQQR